MGDEQHAAYLWHGDASTPLSSAAFKRLSQVARVIRGTSRHTDVTAHVGRMIAEGESRSSLVHLSSQFHWHASGLTLSLLLFHSFSCLWCEK